MKKLYLVTMEYEGTQEVPVWADDVAEAVAIARVDADRCDVDVELSGERFPVFPHHPDCERREENEVEQ